jgi:hypothetical protein
VELELRALAAVECGAAAVVPMMEEDVDSVLWLRRRRMECSGTEKDVAWDGKTLHGTIQPFSGEAGGSNGELLPRRVRRDHLQWGKGATWLEVERMTGQFSIS